MYASLCALLNFSAAPVNIGKVVSVREKEWGIRILRALYLSPIIHRPSQMEIQITIERSREGSEKADYSESEEMGENTTRLAMIPLAQSTTMLAYSAIERRSV